MRDDLEKLDNELGLQEQWNDFIGQPDESIGFSEEDVIDDKELRSCNKDIAEAERILHDYVGEGRNATQLPIRCENLVLKREQEQEAADDDEGPRLPPIYPIAHYPVDDDGYDHAGWWPRENR